MSSRAYAAVSAVAFTVLALLQLTRAIRAWPVEIAGGSCRSGGRGWREW